MSCCATNEIVLADNKHTTGGLLTNEGGEHWHGVRLCELSGCVGHHRNVAQRARQLHRQLGRLVTAARRARRGGGPALPHVKS